MELWVRDDLPDSAGLTAAYVDVEFDPTQLQFGSIDHGDTYTQFAGGEPSAGGILPQEDRIERLGGATMAPGAAVGEWTHVATVHATAKAPFSGSPRLRVKPSYDGVAGLGVGTIPSDRIDVTGVPPPPPIDLVIEVVGRGKVLTNPDRAAYSFPDVVVLTAVPDSGWEFDHWEGYPSGSQNPYAISVGGDGVLVTAVFQPTP
ncbi:MAG: hypothetical protein ACE5EX_06455, partial [Phycisphaerae bacterium]